MDKVFEEILAEFNRIQTALRDERKQCLEDRRFCFVSGAQWEDSLGQQFKNKPRLETNKIRLSVLRILNEYKGNRVGVTFIGKSGAKNNELAEACADLYRSCEQDSIAEEAYDNAFLEALSGGFGAWRLHHEYDDEENNDDERQSIRISPIHDADRFVFFDLDAKRQDKADATKCFIVSSMTHEAFKKEYKKDPVSFPTQIQSTYFDWYTPTVAYIAEVYVKEIHKTKVHIFQDVDGAEVRVLKEDYEEKSSFLLNSGAKELRTKSIKKKRVHKYIMDGSGILEDCGYIAGKEIPVVPVYGTYLYIDNVERVSGHVRAAKDMQRLKNMQISRLAEIAALSPVEKPIFTSDQIAGHQYQWSREHIDNYPYMLINPIIDQNGNTQIVGPAGYTKPPQVPPAMAALIGTTEQDIKDLLGNQEQGQQLQPQISGLAIELVQTRLDVQSFNYVANMAKAIRRSGEIWLSMAKEVYVEQDRELRGVSNTGNYTNITLKKPELDKSLALIYKNNLENAEFDITTVIGPSSVSKKQAVVRALLTLLQVIQDPETIQVLSSMIISNMEGEGIEEVRQYFRDKLIRIGVVKGTQEEQQEIGAKPQPTQDPQSQFLLASTQQAAAMAQKAQADTQLALAKTEESKVKAHSLLIGAHKNG